MKMGKMIYGDFEALTFEKQIETIKELFLSIGFDLKVEIKILCEMWGCLADEKKYYSRVFFMNNKCGGIPIEFFRGDETIPINKYFNQLPQGEGKTLSESLYSLYDECFTCIEHKYLLDLDYYLI